MSTEMDVGMLAAFVQKLKDLQTENTNLKAENAELKTLSLSPSPFQVVCAEDVPRDQQCSIKLPTGKFTFPTPSHQLERSVWRNREFIKYIDSIGLRGKRVESTLVTHWFKTKWFSHEVLGPRRMADAGFSSVDIPFITTHHIIPQGVGGPDSVYNFALVPRPVNSHFGNLITQEAIAWVGMAQAHVAFQIGKFSARRNASAHDESTFDPFAVDCPSRAVTKRRRPAEESGKQVRPRGTGATLEIHVRAVHTEEYDDDEPRFVDVTQSVLSSSSAGLSTHDLKQQSAPRDRGNLTARLAFSCRPFTPVDTALEEALFTFFDATCATLGVPPEQCAVQKAVASFKERIYAASSKSFWVQRVPELAEDVRLVIQSGGQRTPRMMEVCLELKEARQKLEEITTPPPGVNGVFTKVAKGIEDVLELAQWWLPSGCRAQFNVLRQVRDVFSTNQGIAAAAPIAAAALASVSASAATMRAWDSHLRREERLCADMEMDDRSSYRARCDASFLGALDSESVQALAQAADHLRRLASDCKSGSAMQLASAPVPADAPPAGTRGAAVKPTLERVELCVLPPIEAIEGSSASVLSVPTALLSMPPECILQFIAENVLLPPKPCGSKLE